MTGEVFELTPEQKAVVNHPLNEHGRVLSGPGTGKSLTAVAYAERLLSLHHPPHIKFLTFTRAATAEIADKLFKNTATSTLRPSTFHSFAISVLLRNPGVASYPEPLRIPDVYEQDLINQHLALLLQIKKPRVEKLMADMASNWETLGAREDPEVPPEERNAFVEVWSWHRRVFGYTLLAELPDLFRNALINNTYLDGIDYDLLIVDEYQDLNACELNVLNNLATRQTAILAIGDDDQSVYGFRNAHPEGIRRFLDDFDTDKDYELTICHRSAQAIVEWSQHVIQGHDDDRDRQPPKLPEDAPTGQVALLEFGEWSPEYHPEADGIAKLVYWLIESEKIPPSEILILHRADKNGCFSRPIREALNDLEIDVQDPTMVDEILTVRDNRWLLATLRLLVNQSDSLAWWTLVDLKKGLGPGFFRYICDQALENSTTFGEVFSELAVSEFPDAPQGTAKRAANLWDSLQQTLAQFDDPVLGEESGWGAWIIHHVPDPLLESCSEEMIALLTNVDTATQQDIAEDLGQYLSSLQPIAKDLARAKDHSVRLMSMTSSKGLTVQATIVAGVEEGIVPHPKGDLDEERRLLFVAMTRAREHLYLTWSKSRKDSTATLGNTNWTSRQHCNFLTEGPVQSQDGAAYIQQLLDAI